VRCYPQKCIDSGIHGIHAGGGDIESDRRDRVDDVRGITANHETCRGDKAIFEIVLLRDVAYNGYRI